MKTFAATSFVLMGMLAAPAALHGQAMVGYGINVGRAGAAGVGSGAGLAGIMSKMKNTTDQAGEGKTSSRTYRRSQPEFEQDDLEPTVIRLESGDSKAATATSGERKMKGGVVISGLPANAGSSASKADVQVRELKPQPAFQAGSPAAGSGGASSSSTGRRTRGGSVPAAETAGTRNRSETNRSLSAQMETASEGVSARAQIPAAPAPVVAEQPNPNSASVSVRVVEGPAKRRRADGDTNRPPIETRKPEKVVDIAVGEAIEEVIERLGRPLLSLKGIAGEEYTEKYTFRTKDGLKVIVLARNGKVTGVSTGKQSLSVQAGLR